MLMGTSGSELIQSIDTDSNNNIYIYGDFNDYKVDMFGNVLWQKTTTLSATPPFGLGSPALATDSIGRHYIRYVSGRKAGIVKIDNNNGNVINTKIIDLASDNQAAYISDFATDSTNAVYACTALTPPSGNPEVHLIKLDSSSNILWQKTLNYSTSTDAETSEQLFVDSSDNVYLSTYIDGSSFTGAIVYKFNSSGTLQWSRLITDTNIRGISIDSSLNVFLLGDGVPTSPDIFADVYLIKLNSSGTTQWQKKITATTSDPEGSGQGGIAIDQYNNIYIQGIGYYFSYIIKFDNSGNVLWSNKLSNGATRLWTAGGLKVKGDSLLATGYTNIVGGSGSNDGYLIRVPTDGSKLGNFIINSGTFKYLSFSPTISTASLTITSGSAGISTATYSLLSETLTFSNSSDVFTRIDL
jgi:hypothetical protein